LRYDIFRDDKVIAGAYLGKAVTNTAPTGSVSAVTHTATTTILDLSLYAPIMGGVTAPKYFMLMFMPYVNWVARGNSPTFDWSLFPSSSNLDWDHLSVTQGSNDAFIYGQPETTRANLINSFFDGATNEDRIVVGSNGFFFEEDSAQTLEVITITQPVSPTASQFVSGGGTYVDLVGTPVGTNYRFTVFYAAPTYYKVNDVISLFRYLDTKGNVTIYNFTVETVGASSITLLATFSTIRLYSNDKLHYTRTSRTVPTVSTYYPIPKTMFQFGGTGKDYPSYTYMGRNTFGDVEYYFLEEVTFSSYASMYETRRFRPLYYGDVIQWAYLSKDTHEIKDLPSVSFNSTVVAAMGEDGMALVDRDRAYALKLPHPITPQVRSIGGTVGWFETELDSDGKLVGKKVRIVVTYSFEDSFGNKYESSVTGIEDAVIRPIPLNDGSKRTEQVEVLVKTIPNTLQIPASNVRINVYRDFTDENSNTKIPFQLDKSVDNDTRVAYISIKIGDVPSALASNNIPRLYSSTNESEGNNVTGPNTKFLTSVGNRVVTGNEYSPGYFTCKCNSIFDFTNAGVNKSPFTAYLELCLYKTVSSLGTTYGDGFLFVTTPLGVKSGPTLISGSADAEISSYYPTVGGATGWAPYSVLPIDPGGYVISGISYEDKSNTFIIVSYDLSTVIDGVTEYKLRSMSNNFPRALDIDFLGDVFTKNTISVTSNKYVCVDANTRWNDASLSPLTIPAGGVTTLANVPTALAQHYQSMLNYPIVDTVTQDAVNTKDAYIVVASTTEVYYYRNTTGARRVDIAGKFVVFHGLGNFGDPRDIDGTTLDWDSDLIFLAGTETTTTDGTTTWGIALLTPVKPQNTGAAVTYTTRPGIIWNAFADSCPSFKVFATAETTKQWCAIHGFDAGGDLTTITTTANSLPLITVGDNTTIELSTADRNIVTGKLPKLNGSFQVKTRTDSAGASSLVLRTGRLSETFMTGSHTLAYSSGLAGSKVGMRGITVLNVSEVRIATTTTQSVAVGEILFIIFRGDEFNSINLSMSGWFKVSAATTNKAYVDVYATNRDQVLFTSVRWACIVRIPPGTITKTGYTNCIPVPVPVPMWFGNAESLYDLAMPLFTGNKNLTNVPAIAVSKRFAMAISAVMMHFVKGYFENGDGNVLATQVPDNGFLAELTKAPINKKLYYDFDMRTGNATKYDIDLIVAENTAIVAKLSDNYIKAVANCTAKSSYTFSTDEGLIELNSANLTDTFGFRQDLYPNRVRWTKQINKTSSGTKEGLQFKETFYRDIESGDGDVITGITAFQNTALVSKNESLWRLTFSDTDNTVNVQRVQSTVGAVSGKNVVANDTYAFFVHPTGIYVTDGNNVQSMLRTSRPFIKRTLPSSDLIEQGASRHNPLNKLVSLGVPYSAVDDTTTDVVDAQFTYCYNDQVMGWSVDTNIPAVWWLRVDNLEYFAGQDGSVYRLRYEKYLTKFNDYQDPINFKLRTRYLATSEVMNFKFYRNVLFQFGADSDFTMTASYRLNYYTADEPLGTLTLTGASTAAGIASFGTTRFVAPRRQTFGTRLAQVSILLTNSEANTDSPVYFVGVEGLILGTRLTPMTGMRPGTDQR
jgi:hypothetical protein